MKVAFVALIDRALKGDDIKPHLGMQIADRACLQRCVVFHAMRILTELHDPRITDSVVQKAELPNLSIKVQSEAEGTCGTVNGICDLLQLDFITRQSPE